MLTKKCSKCNKDKSLEDFKSDKRRRDGRASWCKSCHNKYNNERRSLIPREVLLNKALEYRTKNKEHIRARYNKWVTNNPDDALRYRLKKYGISVEYFFELYKMQDGKCAICKEKQEDKYSRRIHVDHDHVTNKVRGLLCTGCNTAIGLFRENVDALKNAISYLESPPNTACTRRGAGAAISSNNLGVAPRG